MLKLLAEIFSPLLVTLSRVNVNDFYVTFYNDLGHHLHSTSEPNYIEFQPFPPDRHQRAVAITTIS